MTKLTLSYAAVPQRGGLGLNMHHMIEALRSDFELTVFSLDSIEGVDSRTVLRSKICKGVGRIPYVRRLRDLQNCWSSRHFDLSVAKCLEPGTIFQGLTGVCEKSLQKARQLGYRTVLDVGTAHVDTFVAQQKEECAKFGVRLSLNATLQTRTRREYDSVDLIRVMSHYAKQTFIERGFSSEKILVAYPPMDLTQFPVAAFRERKFRVAFAGLLEPWKGFHYLIEAFNKFDRKDAELVLFGGPGSRPVSQYLQWHMSRNPAIHVSPGDIRKVGYGDVYGKCSVLVHPSLTDGFGYVVAEAMASGIPVVVTSSTGASDLIKDGVNGYIVPCRDPNAITDRLFHLADHPALLREMGAAARQTIGELTAERFRAVYVNRLKAAKDNYAKA